METEFKTKNIQCLDAASEVENEKELAATTEIERAIASISSLNAVQRHLFDLLEPVSKMQMHLIAALKCAVDEQHQAIQTLQFELSARVLTVENHSLPTFGKLGLNFELVDMQPAECPIAL